jgi:hypothetical protein
MGSRAIQVRESGSVGADSSGPGVRLPFAFERVASASEARDTGARAGNHTLLGNGANAFIEPVHV